MTPPIEPTAYGDIGTYSPKRLAPCLNTTINQHQLNLNVKRTIAKDREPSIIDGSTGHLLNTTLTSES